MNKVETFVVTLFYAYFGINNITTFEINNVLFLKCMYMYVHNKSREQSTVKLIYKPNTDCIPLYAKPNNWLRRDKSLKHMLT